MIIEKGYLKGEITGFNNKKTIFEFIDGNTWVQAQFKRCSHQTFMPHAKVRDINGRYYLEIEGMREGVEVRRAES